MLRAMQCEEVGNGEAFLLRGYQVEAGEKVIGIDLGTTNSAIAAIEAPPCSSSLLSALTILEAVKKDMIFNAYQ